MKHILGHVAMLAVAAALAGAAAAAPSETNDAQRANLAVAETWGQGTRALRVDAAAGEVTALAEFCGLGAGGTVEFPIVGELSDRDYEAMFRTFARPGAIAAALEQLGVPRGGNVNAYTFDFWPRGERVAIDVAPLGATNAVWTPLQNYIADLTTRAKIAVDSFVYCGSQDDADAAPGSRVCDSFAPNSVLSTYNDSQTVLDMPARLGQSDVYGRFVLAPDCGLKPFGLYVLRFRPARRADGLRRVREFTLAIAKTAGGAEYTLAEAGRPATTGDAAALADAIRKLVADGFDPFVSVHFDDSLTVAEAAAQAQFIEKIEGDGGIRVRGPRNGGIYYRGFLPSAEWRVRKDRPSQPWEMRLAADDTGAAKATLVKTIEDWTSTDSLDPVLTTQEFLAATPAEAAKVVAEQGAGLPVMLVFAPADMRLSRLMPFVSAFAGTHPTAYVFGEK